MSSRRVRLPSPSSFPSILPNLSRLALGLGLFLAFATNLAEGHPAVQPAAPANEEELEGVLEVLHEDRVDGSRYIHFLHTGTERLSLSFATDPPELLTGSRVKARGVRTGQVLALGPGKTSVQTLTVAVPNTFGAQQTLVILVNFQDTPIEPFTPDSVRTAFFTTTSNFWLENSYQQTSLAGDVAGWFTIAYNSTGCDSSSIANLAEAAATAAGYNLSAYTHHVYVFPSNNYCGWGGLSTVGGNPSKAWLNGTIDLAFTSHELGHGLGLYHSHALDCGAATIGTTMSSTFPPPPGTCYVIEYGNLVDAMSSGFPGHYNAFQKERLGWLNYGSSPPITTVTTSGTYILDAYELASLGSKALKILKSTDSTTGAKTWYYVEARKAIGFDSFLATTQNFVGIASTIQDGALVSLGTDGNGNSGKLLDMSPATDTSIWDWLVDAPLLVGQSFSDPAAGVTITTAWVTSTEAAVTVSLGAVSCMPGNPTVALSPSQSQSVQAGTTVTYTVSVTNSDSSGCATSTFGLRASAPAGWTAAFTNSSLTVNPGATASTTLQVTSPDATADGAYTVGVLGTNTGATSYTGSSSATYVIASAAGLSVTVTTNQASYTPGQTVSSTAIVTSGGNPVANAMVTFTVTKSNGAVVIGTATTGATGAAVYKLRIGRKDPVGVYQVGAKEDNAGTSVTATTTFMVQ